MNFNLVKGDLIALAKAGMYDLIAHGCNCQNRMKRGLAPQMAAAFGVDRYLLETAVFKGDINKLGQIESHTKFLYGPSGQTTGHVDVANCYTQYYYTSEERPVAIDYEALTLCLRKINSIWRGKHIGLPYLIGGGLAGGDMDTLMHIHQQELTDMKVTFVQYEPHANG